MGSPVPVSGVDVKAFEKVASSFEEIAQALQKQALAETSRACQEIVLAVRIHYFLNKLGLIDIDASVQAQRLEVLLSYWQSVSEFRHGISPLHL